jgi:hypothetical protein
MGLCATSLISFRIFWIMSELRTNFSFQSNEGGGMMTSIDQLYILLGS